MRKLAILLALVAISASASAVISFSDDFGGAAGTLGAGWTDTSATAAVTAGWTGTDSPSSQNGTGQIDYGSAIDELWSITHDIGTGDFHAEVSWNNISTPAGLSQFYLHLNDPTGGTGQQLGFKTWANVLYVENIDSVTFAGTWVNDPIAADQVTSFDIIVDYVEATGALDMQFSFNGAAMTTIPGTYLGAGDALRNLEIRSSIWGATYNGGLNSTISIDSFSVDVPEPATMALLGLGGILLRRRKH